MMRNICLFFSVLFCIQCHPLCEQVTLVSGNSFDLSGLKSVEISIIMSNDYRITISPCNTLEINGSKSYIFVETFSPTIIIPYTNQLQPTINQYQLIDPQKPSTGVILNYLHNSNSHSVSLSIYCSDITSYIITCTNSSNMLKCSTYHSNGCIRPNKFWLFLIRYQAIFAGFCCVISLLQLLLGYFIIRITIFVYAVMSVTFCAIVITAQNYPYFIYPKEYQLAVFIVSFAILTGVILGITMLTIPRLGYVNIGIWVALIFTLLLQNSILFLTKTLIALYITLGVTSLIMIVISQLALKFFIVLSTSLTGSFGLVRPLGFFLPHYPNQLQNIWSSNSSTPWQFYLYLISIIVLTILGTIFQLWLYNKKGIISNKKYYLQQQGDLRDKIKNLLQFKQLKNLLKEGREQVIFLRNLVVSGSEGDEIQSGDMSVSEQQSEYIEMKKMSRKQQYQESTHKNNNQIRVKQQSHQISNQRPNLSKNKIK